MYEHVDVSFDPNYWQNFVRKIDIEMVVLRCVFVYEFLNFPNVQILCRNEQMDRQMVSHRYAHEYD